MTMLRFIELKIGNAAGPSGIVADMLTASGEAGIDLITKLVHSIVCQGVIPSDLELSYLIVLNFRGTYFRGRRFRKVSREFIFADDLF